MWGRDGMGTDEHKLQQSRATHLQHGFASGKFPLYAFHTKEL